MSPLFSTHRDNIPFHTNTQTEKIINLIYSKAYQNIIEIQKIEILISLNTDSGKDRDRIIIYIKMKIKVVHNNIIDGNNHNK